VYLNGFSLALSLSLQFDKTCEKKGIEEGRWRREKNFRSVRIGVKLCNPINGNRADIAQVAVWRIVQRPEPEEYEVSYGHWRADAQLGRKGQRLAVRRHGLVNRQPGHPLPLTQPLYLLVPRLRA
jgi:hypothetical protein